MKRISFSTGPLSRGRKNQAIYRQHLQSSDASICYFCQTELELAPEILRSSRDFYVGVNSFGYDVWDGCTVSEHLMLIPKRHVASLAELTPAELQDYAEQLAQAESQGYSLYTRSPDNITKSITHLHTHLIKLEPTRRNLLIYLRSPHILLSK